MELETANDAGEDMRIGRPELFSVDIGYGMMISDTDDGIGVGMLVDDVQGSLDEHIVGSGIGAPEP
jgi:hypothetical protein